jgi:hypothetical protein
MSDNFWDQSVGVEEEEVMSSPDRPGAFIRVNGANVRVDVGSSFFESIKAEAQNAGLGKFRVYLNGSEIKPSQAPDTIQDGMMVEVRPYDVAG